MYRLPKREGTHSIKKKEVEKLREASTVYTIYRVGGRETITRENKKLEGGSRKNGKLLIERVN
jgi:hypothetical protein